MCKILPILSTAELLLVRSAAEQKFYKACQDQLPANWLVLFSTSWVGVTPTGRPYDGEADFIVFVPHKGILVVEVKGGGVEFSPEERWFSLDASGVRHTISDPFDQAKREKYALRDILRKDRQWKGTKATFGHAVMLSDVSSAEGVISPQSPYQIVGGAPNVLQLQSWIERVLEFWASEDASGLSARDLSTAESILCRRILVRPALSVRLDAENAIRLELTEQQSRVLRGLGSRQWAAISGGAGTGKTLLAIERAKELAAEGKRTLFLCYNHLLGDFAKHYCLGHQSLFAMSFHDLCTWKIREAKQASGRDLLAEAKGSYPTTGANDLFDIQMPYALAVSCELLAERFDAILIDEGQDFKEEYWLPIEMLLAEGESSYFYVFYDDNQSLYTISSAIPIKERSFVLTFNCRNTQAIHGLAYREFKGPKTDPPPGNVGVPVETIGEESLDKQAVSIRRSIQKLISEEGVAPERIAVLVSDIGKADYYKSLTSTSLSKAEWILEGAAAGMGVRVDTVRRFKGLEADIVYLWGWRCQNSKQTEELFYVGASRAKSCLTLVGTRSECERLIKGSS